MVSFAVIQEVLQGFDQESHYRVAREAMWALPIVESPLTRETIESAVDLYRRARLKWGRPRMGPPTGATTATLLAALAVRHCHPEGGVEGEARVCLPIVWLAKRPLCSAQRHAAHAAFSLIIAALMRR